jgi:Rha family phage regulatory protein
MKLIRNIENDLVFLTTKKDAVTTSRVLAETFKKRHDNLLTKIDKLRSEDKETFTALRIKASKYKDDSGKMNKEFILNRDAYAFFAMGFTGKKANRFKIEFIQAFNKMEEWIKDRLQNSIEYKVMSDTLSEVRKLAGKETKNHHYSNEGRLVNYAMTGKFGKIERDALGQDDLDLLYNLQRRNAALIGAGMPYKDRKESLTIFAELQKTKSPTQEKSK